MKIKENALEKANIKEHPQKYLRMSGLNHIQQKLEREKCKNDEDYFLNQSTCPDPGKTETLGFWYGKQERHALHVQHVE